MNQLLFERACGAIGPNVFARLECTKLLRSFRPAPRLRFDGGERAVVDERNEDNHVNLWAHQAGVNALALEKFDGRL